MSACSEHILATVDARLPKRVRWLLAGTPLDFDFSPERYGLRQVTDGDVVGGPVPQVWTDCQLIGRYDYAEGGGASPWIAIRRTDAFICGLDIERAGGTTFVFNSSLDRFIETFTLLDPYLRAGRGPPPTIVSQVKALDPEACAVSEWQVIIEATTAE